MLVIPKEKTREELLFELEEAKKQTEKAQKKLYKSIDNYLNLLYERTKKTNNEGHK